MCLLRIIFTLTSAFHINPGCQLERFFGMSMPENILMKLSSQYGSPIFTRGESGSVIFAQISTDTLCWVW